MLDSIHQLIMVPRLCMDYVREIKHLVEQPAFYHTLT
jgi:hypothetical protein